MSLPQAAVGPDRLPWLDDGDEQPVGTGLRSRLPMVAGGFVALAALSYWVGMHSRRQPEPSSPPARPSMTVHLPEARPVEPHIKLDRISQIELEAQPTARAAPHVPEKVARPAFQPPARAERAQTRAGHAAKPLALWPARQSAGARGRLVRIGAFGSSLQAKRGWSATVRSYPALASLPVVVVETRNSKGTHFYRLQIGTTSQAHSEVLCQRMDRIAFSCAVIGLPWKPQGVER